MPGLKPAWGFEPQTYALRKHCSTTELSWHRVEHYTQFVGMLASQPSPFRGSRPIRAYFAGGVIAGKSDLDQLAGGLNNGFVIRELKRAFSHRCLICVFPYGDVQFLNAPSECDFMCWVEYIKTESFDFPAAIKHGHGFAAVVSGNGQQRAKGQ